MDQDRRIVVFDLDRTITRYGTFSPFLIWTCRERPLSTFNSIPIMFRMLLYRVGLVKRKALKEYMLRTLLAGVDREQMTASAESFAARLTAKCLRHRAIERIERHRAQGDFLVLATASMDFYAKPIGEALGFDLVVGTESKWDENDCLVPLIAGENCYGPDKLRILKRSLNGHFSGLEPGVSIAYSDHISDLPLLEWVENGIAVNPSSALRIHATKAGLPIEDWG